MALAAAILRKGGANAYEKARRALIPESRDWWDEHVADEEHPATAEGLQALRLEKLNRYQTHLDRKFERTLAMLSKMKSLRGG